MPTSSPANRYDRAAKAVDDLAADGATGATSVSDLISKLVGSPRIIWLMLPAGAVTDEMVTDLSGALAKDDIIIDGGNSFYKDDIRRARDLAAKGLRYIDCGTSGGVWGIDRGYCMMIGGPKNAVDAADPIFSALAPGLGDIPRTANRQGRDPRVERGYLHVGPAGAGHFVKMIHNGIEYGLMQAYGEGFNILANKASRALPEAERFTLNLADIAEVWRRGSVISSWLLDLTATALARDPALASFSGVVQDSGEGRWTIEAAIEEAVPADVLAAALFARFRSRQDHTLPKKCCRPCGSGLAAMWKRRRRAIRRPMWWHQRRTRRGHSHAGRSPRCIRTQRCRRDGRPPDAQNGRSVHDGVVRRDWRSG